MTKILLSCCLLALLSGTSGAQAALGTSERMRADSTAVRAAETPPQPGPTRWPGLNWYLGVGCVSLLAVQRIRWFNPQRRLRHPQP